MKHKRFDYYIIYQHFDSFTKCDTVVLTIHELHFSPDGDDSTFHYKVGENISLPCNNEVYPDCSSTTWNFYSIELVAYGVILKKSGRAERLRLGSDCSLNVRRVKTEDAGVYTCQQYLTEGGSQHGEDASIYLSVETSKYVSFN